MAAPLKLGDVVEGHSYIGGDPNQKENWVDVDGLVSSGLTGQPFLDLLSKQHPSIVNSLKALSEGRQAVPANRVMTDPYWSKVFQLAQQYDPTLDAASYPARQKTRIDFTSGTSALNIRNLNQAIGHLSSLATAIPKVAGHSGLLGLSRLLNKGENTYADYNGDPGIVDYDVPRTALSAELASVFKGKGTTSEKEIDKFYNMLNMDRSTEQKQAGVRGLVDLLHSRLDELGQQYNQGMGTTKQGITLLNPDSQKQFQALGTLGLQKKKYIVEQE